MLSRLATFKNFRPCGDTGINTMALARVGFSYNPNSHIVECMCCNYQVGLFNPKKDIKVIIDQHLKFSAECEFNKAYNILSVEDNLFLSDNARFLATSTRFGSLINGANSRFSRLSRLSTDSDDFWNFNTIEPNSWAGYSFAFEESVMEINARIMNRVKESVNDNADDEYDNVASKMTHLINQLPTGILNTVQTQSQNVQQSQGIRQEEDDTTRSVSLRASEVEARLDTPLLQALIAQGFQREHLRNTLDYLIQKGEYPTSSENLIQVTLSRVGDEFLHQRLLSQAYSSIQVSTCKSGYTPNEGEIGESYFNNPLAILNNDDQLNLRLRNCRSPYDMPPTGVSMRGDGSAFGSSLFQRRSIDTLERAELNFRETVTVRYNSPGQVGLHYSQEVDLELFERYRDIEIVFALIVLLYIFTVDLYDIDD